MNEAPSDHQPWPARAALLLGLGAALGVAFEAVLDGPGPRWSDDPWRLALASLIAVGGVAFGLTLERRRWPWSIAFALACGVVVAAVFHWNGSPSGWSGGDGWRVVAALLAAVIAAPLFQTARDVRPGPVTYARVFDHAWTNLVLWFAAWAFVLVSWLLAQLLAELFKLIGITVLRDLLRRDWFTWLLIGGAFGAALGLLRDRDGVLNQLQRIVTAILSVLAPVLAAGLVLFVLALPFTGLQPLWDQTAATTPILLVCLIGAVILANAVIGNGDEAEARPRPLRYAALALAATTLPLAIVAAVSTGKRIAQHGFTPERLWGLVFVIVATALGTAYAVALLRGRGGWPERLRPANLNLAIGICALALLLATPLINFGAISTRDQLARLNSGRVSPQQFDWAALRFDFGPSGRAALDRLARGGTPAVRQYARQALTYVNRWDLAEANRLGQRGVQLGTTLRVLPVPVPVPEALRRVVAQRQICGFGACTLFWRRGETQAVAVGFACENCPAQVSLVRFTDGTWQPNGPLGEIWARGPSNSTAVAEQGRRAAAGQVEIRQVPRRQVFIGGEPVGGTFP